MSGEPTPQAEQPHPRKTPRLKQRLSLEALTQVFSDCADFSARQLRLGGTGQVVTVCWLEGMAKTERLNDYVFRPLAQDRRLEAARGEAACGNGSGAECGCAALFPGKWVRFERAHNGRRVS